MLCGQTHLDPYRAQERKDIFGKAENITELTGTSKFTSFETVAPATRHNTAGDMLSQQSGAPWISNCGGMRARWRWSGAPGLRERVLHGVSMVRGVSVVHSEQSGQRLVLQEPGGAPKGEAAESSRVCPTLPGGTWRSRTRRGPAGGGIAESLWFSYEVLLPPPLRISVSAQQTESDGEFFGPSLGNSWQRLSEIN